MKAVSASAKGLREDKKVAGQQETETKTIFFWSQRVETIDISFPLGYTFQWSSFTRSSNDWRPKGGVIVKSKALKGDGFLSFEALLEVARVGAGGLVLRFTGASMVASRRKLGWRKR